MGSGLKPNGLKVKRLRIQRGWPQEQLARISDVSPRTIQRLEAGGNASLETLRSIASAFELEVRDLLSETQGVAVSGIATEYPEMGRIASDDSDQCGSGETPSIPSQGGGSERAMPDRFILVLPEQAAAPLAQLDASVPKIRSEMPIAGALTDFHSYIPFLKGILGSFVAILLTAGAIGLSPLLLRHEAVQEAADAADISAQRTVIPLTSNLATRSEEIPPASETVVRVPAPPQTERARVKRAVLGMVAKRIWGVQMNEARLIEPSAGPADGHSLAATRIDEPHRSEAVDSIVETEIAELHPATTVQFSKLLQLPSAAAGTTAGAEKDKPGLTRFVGGGATGGYAALSNSLRQSGMKTASFFSSVGISFKRAF